jgi:hypothetical protein
VYVYTVLRFYTVFFRALTGFLYSAFFAYTGFFYSIFKRKLYQFCRLLLYKTPDKFVVFTPKKHAKPKNTPVQAHHRHAKPYRRTTTGHRQTTKKPYRHASTTRRTLQANQTPTGTGAQARYRRTAPPAQAHQTTSTGTPAHKAQAHLCHHSTGTKKPDDGRVYGFMGLCHKYQKRSIAKNNPISAAKITSAHRFGLVWVW